LGVGYHKKGGTKPKNVLHLSEKRYSWTQVS
jgi:hypothetical protein